MTTIDFIVVSLFLVLVIYYLLTTSILSQQFTIIRAIDDLAQPMTKKHRDRQITTVRIHLSLLESRMNIGRVVYIITTVWIAVLVAVVVFYVKINTIDRWVLLAAVVMVTTHQCLFIYQHHVQRRINAASYWISPSIKR